MRCSFQESEQVSAAVGETGSCAGEGRPRGGRDEEEVTKISPVGRELFSLVCYNLNYQKCFRSQYDNCMTTKFLHYEIGRVQTH